MRGQPVAQTGKARARGATTLTPSQAKRFARHVEEWFSANARDLPWRRDRTGYSALVSELMLHQTQVSRVIDSFERFMERFPTVASLARAPEPEVLAAWNGLGYYRRAKHLHAAAKAIVAGHGGEVPGDPESLRRLPGVGRYTAGAIASIIHARREPIVDGNVARVLARLTALPPGTRDRRGRDWEWAVAKALVDAAADPGGLNEGLMELGAVVCTPVNPQCGLCPLRRSCNAARHDIQHLVPPPKQTTARSRVHHHVVLVECNGMILLERRPDRGMWAGMWQPLTVESARRQSPAALRAALPIRLGAITKRESFVHRTTHREVLFHVFVGTARNSGLSTGRADGRTWRRPEEVDDLPMGNPQRRIARLLVDAARAPSRSPATIRA